MPGQRLALGAPTAGLRAYVGVAGGFATPAELGSRSTDTLAGLGPAPLRGGRPAARSGPPRTRRTSRTYHRSGAAGDLTLDVMLGPRDDWFTAPPYAGCSSRRGR